MCTYKIVLRQLCHLIVLKWYCASEKLFYL